MAQDEPVANKRSSDRRRMLKTGKIIFSQGGSVIDCTVRNVSTTGATLNVQNAVAVPENFLVALGRQRATLYCGLAKDGRPWHQVLYLNFSLPGPTISRSQGSQLLTNIHADSALKRSH